ncbi:hypothetical protein [Dyella flagellata]|uniref:hypothetical protein n=1 Tax=Dyella flagellata TaxID=1867833 RepID=UPI003847A222
MLISNSFTNNRRDSHEIGLFHGMALAQVRETRVSMPKLIGSVLVALNIGLHYSLTSRATIFV